MGLAFPFFNACCILGFNIIFFCTFQLIENVRKKKAGAIVCRLRHDVIQTREGISELPAS